MRPGTKWLAAAAERDRAVENEFRKRVVAAGYEVTGETSGWVTAQKGDRKIGANTIIDLWNWIEYTKRRKQ